MGARRGLQSAGTRPPEVPYGLRAGSGWDRAGSTAAPVVLRSFDTTPSPPHHHPLHLYPPLVMARRWMCGRSRSSCGAASTPRLAARPAPTLCCSSRWVGGWVAVWRARWWWYGGAGGGDAGRQLLMAGWLGRAHPVLGAAGREMQAGGSEASGPHLRQSPHPATLLRLCSLPCGPPTPVVCVQDVLLTVPERNGAGRLEDLSGAWEWGEGAWPPPAGVLLAVDYATCRPAPAFLLPATCSTPCSAA